jgi:hypothetical protein
MLRIIEGFWNTADKELREEAEKRKRTTTPWCGFVLPAFVAAVERNKLLTIERPVEFIKRSTKLQGLIPGALTAAISTASSAFQERLPNRQRSSCNIGIGRLAGAVVCSNAV